MPLPPDSRARFESMLQAEAADQPWGAERDARNAKRIQVVPQILGLLQKLREGTIELPEFREIFDTKTRTDWDGFGLKGMSGAMFLNKLVMHVPDQTAVKQELLNAISLPADVPAAQQQLSVFLRFLDRLINTKVVTKMKLQPGRAPFFFSAWWHLQNREQWPAYYESARATMEQLGLFMESGDAVRDYFAFRDRWMELAQEFQLDSWSLEAVLIHAHRAGRTIPPIKDPVPKPPAVDPPPVTPPPLVDDDGAPKHREVQWMLAKIGKKLGLKVWIASNDQNRVWNGERLGDYSISELPNLGIGEDAQKIVNLIDVLWLKGNNQVVSAFEIESSTSIYSGLLRMSDLNTTCPNLNFPCYIALPAEREPEVIRQLSRATFQALDLHSRCAYFTLEALKAELGAILKWSKDADCIRELAKWVGDAG